MAATVRMADPGGEHHELGDEIDAALLAVARSGRYVLGPQVDTFEAEFADWLGRAHSIGVASGTDALELALRASGCGRGDEVVTAANAGGYATTAALVIGAVPVHVDVEEDSLLLDPARVEEVIGPRTAAVVVTHLFGRLHPGIDRIASLCDRHGVALVEDCAQAAGAHRAGRQAGTFGTLAAHSFYPTKNLGALGDAGMVSTDDPALARRLRSLRQYGWGHPQAVELQGGRNSRLDEVQAAVLRVKLRHLGELVDRRRAAARTYRAAAPRRWWSGLDDTTDAAHLAVTRTPDRERFRKEADAAGISTAVHFPTPDHLQRGFGTSRAVLPVTEAACREVVSLPCHSQLTTAEVARVADFLAAWHDGPAQGGEP